MIWDFIQNEVLGMKWLNRVIGSLLSLTGLDMQIVRVIDDVGPLVEDEAERARDHLTPVFMVCAEKGVV